jgi:hypothetical protein
VITGGGKTTDTIKMTWDTTSLTRYNGQYGISATATSLLGSRATFSIPNLLVNNPPAQPGGVSANLEGTVPVVTWPANPEPDLVGYRVLRSTAGGSYSSVGTVSSASFRDQSAPQGQALTYEVVAVRASPVDAAGIASSPSNPSAPVTPSTVVVQPLTLGPHAPPVAAPIKPAPRAPGRAEAGAFPENTFAATLPFKQPIPQATVPTFSPLDPKALGALPQGYSTTSWSQKLRYLGTAALLVVISLVIIRFARKLRTGG